MSSNRIDHDGLFKELISTFFWDFINLFFPEVAEHIEADSIVLLDKEIFVDIAAGEKYEVDLVAKVKFRGKEVFFLIHIESQAQWRARFPKRMFHYFAYLHDNYDLPIYPIALLSFDTPKLEQPDCYQIEFPELDFQVLQFNYRVIQLNRFNWRDYINRPNPVASALMAKMDIKPEDRPKVKLECLRLLATLKLDPARTHLISGFVDTYLKLNAAEELKLTAELESISPKEKESVMEIVTSWMEEGLQKGLQQGLEQGKKQQTLALAERLLGKKIGTIEQSYHEQFQSLSVTQLEELIEALLDFSSKADLTTWLSQQS